MYLNYLFYLFQLRICICKLTFVFTSIIQSYICNDQLVQIMIILIFIGHLRNKVDFLKSDSFKNVQFLLFRGYIYLQIFSCSDEKPIFKMFSSSFIVEKPFNLSIFLYIRLITCFSHVFMRLMRK